MTPLERHIASARMSGLAVCVDPLTIADPYRCHSCGGRDTAATYTGLSAGVVTISATCAGCWTLFVIAFFPVRNGTAHQGLPHYEDHFDRRLHAV